MLVWQSERCSRIFSLRVWSMQYKNPCHQRIIKYVLFQDQYHPYTLNQNLCVNIVLLWLICLLKFEFLCSSTEPWMWSHKLLPITKPGPEHIFLRILWSRYSNVSIFFKKMTLMVNFCHTKKCPFLSALQLLVFSLLREEAGTVHSGLLSSPA